MNQKWVPLNIQRQRAILGLDIQALASMTDLRPQFLEDIECGRLQRIHPLTISKIASALCLKPEVLYEEPQNKHEDLSQALLLSDEMRAVGKGIGIMILTILGIGLLSLIVGTASLVVALSL